MGSKRKSGLKFAFILFLGLFFPASVYADFPNILSLLRFDFGVREDYTDNVDYRSSNKRDEWITRVYGGVRLSTELAPERAPGQVQQEPMGRDRYGINLNYRLGYNHYAKDTYDAYVSHEGRLDTWATIGRRVVLRLKDYLLRSDEPLEARSQEGAPPADFIQGSQRIRATYIRNVLEPSMEYQFGRENRFFLGYQHNYYHNPNEGLQDSQEHSLTPQLDYWFNIRHGISLQYSFARGNFERNPDVDGHTGRARYTYRFNPFTSIFGEYVFVRRDFENPGVDYEVQNPTVGISHAFSPATSGSVQVGYFWYDPERGEKLNGFSVHANLSTRTQFTDFFFGLRGGFREDYFTALNAGLSKYYGAYGSINHRLGQSFSVGLAGSVSQDQFPSDEKVLRWETRASATYQPLRWLSVTLEGLHREDDSNRNTFYIQENRAILQINLTI